MVDVRFGGLSHLTFQASYYIGLKIQNAGFGKPPRFLYTYACLIIICYMGLEMSIRLKSPLPTDSNAYHLQQHASYI